MPKIFISYRREDSQWPVDRIHQALKPHVADPKADIFVDVDNIPVGVDWVAYLDSKVAQCDVLLAVIGPDWLSIKNPKTGMRRLDDPKDFVRIEIASALKRGVSVAPVLLDDVELPEPNDLPEDLRPLLSRQGVNVTRMNFDADVQRLISGLGLIRDAKPAAATSTTTPKPKGSPAPVIALALLVLAAGGVGAYGYTQGWFGRSAEAENPAAPAAAPDPAETAAWGMADGLKSPEAYKSYLASYPKGAHAKDADTALASIADDADWTKAAGRSRADLNAYLSAHPSGAHTEEARTQLTALDESERAAAAAQSEAERREIERRAADQREADRRAADKRADDAAWSIASGGNTIAGYRSYLSSYPSGAYASTARSRIAQLEKPAGYDLNLLHPDVRFAVERARAAEKFAQQRAADARSAAVTADEAAARARSGAAGTSVRTDAPNRFETEVSNGKPSGYGTMYVMSGDFAGDVYRGQWRDGTYSGLGAITYANNPKSQTFQRIRYEGEWAAGNPHGSGVFIWTNDRSYLGYWAVNQRSGAGVLHMPTGRMEGEWIADNLNGQGVEWNTDGTVRRAGRWKDGKLVESLTK